MGIGEFKHFSWNVNQGFCWQRAPYIEDGAYIESKDMRTFVLWQIPPYGGEPAERYKTHDFLDAVKFHEENPET